MDMTPPQPLLSPTVSHRPESGETGVKIFFQEVGPCQGRRQLIKEEWPAGRSPPESLSGTMNGKMGPPPENWVIPQE